MTFPTFQEKHREPLLVWLTGFAGSGKSTLLAEFFRTFQPGVLIPSDQRWEIFRDLAVKEGIPVYPVSDPDSPDLWNNEQAILAELGRNLPGSGVKSIGWDSITPGFERYVTEAMRLADLSSEERKRQAGSANKSALFKPKATYMKMVGSVASYGRHTVWVSHEYSARDSNANEVTRTSITQAETDRFLKHLNLKLSATGPVNQGRHGVRILWVRDRPSLNGRLLVDQRGMFKGFWADLQDLFYGAQVIPWESRDVFANPAEAWALAMEQTVEVDGRPVSAFKDLRHAESAYNKLRQDVLLPLIASAEWKAEHEGDKLAPNRQMATLWREEVTRRLNGIRSESLGGEEEMSDAADA